MRPIQHSFCFAISITLFIFIIDDTISQDCRKNSKQTSHP